jgi:hypothetical protein
VDDGFVDRDGSRAAAAEDGDVVQFGPSHPPRGRWPRWLPISVVGLIVLVVVAAVEHGRGPSDTPRGTSPPATPSATAGTPTAVAVTTAPVTVSQVGHQLLGVTADWELFGRGAGQVVRIQPALGRVTRTAVPMMGSSGPVSFVVGPHGVIIRPLDFVPGYLVPDGRPARGLPAVLSLGGLALPGPDLGHLWIQAGTGERMTMALVGWDGTKTGVTVPVPVGAWPTSDGGGYLLLTGVGGVYDARPDGVRRITTGAVLAVGPTRWLALECDKQYHCVNAVIDRASAARHVLAGPPGDPDASPGVISPDGSTAAVFRGRSAGRRTLQLFDLTSGAQHQVAVPVDKAWFDAGGAVWSPDSRWLFVVARDGTLHVVDARTRRVRDLGVALGPISQLAVRHAPH